MEEDNERKIRYLAQVIGGRVSHNDLKGIESIRRLPWTKEILRKTEELGKQLPQYATSEGIPDFRKASSKF